MQNAWPKFQTYNRTDIEACRESIRQGSHSFYMASLLLPKRIRYPAYSLYAFCRFADDAVDLDRASVSAIHHLRGRLRLIYAGEPFATPIDRAFAKTVARFAIPSALPDALLEGFEWDAHGRRYADIAELRSYAVRVAGSVGAMMAMLMGARSKELVALACDLGVAIQLTNIARDVGEDARAGRLYLPLDWLKDAGVDAEAWLANPVPHEGITEATKRLLLHADILYRRSVSGIERLPMDCRPAIHAARMIYRQIGQEVLRQNHDAISQRTIVSTQRKAWLSLLGTIAAFSPAPSALPPKNALRESQFLVDDIERLDAGAFDARPDLQDIPWWKIEDRLVRVIELFDRLERKDREHVLAIKSGHSTAR